MIRLTCVPNSLIFFNLQNLHRMINIELYNIPIAKKNLVVPKKSLHLVVSKPNRALFPQLWKVYNANLSKEFLCGGHLIIMVLSYMSKRTFSSRNPLRLHLGCLPTVYFFVVVPVLNQHSEHRVVELWYCNHEVVGSNPCLVETI